MGENKKGGRKMYGSDSFPLGPNGQFPRQRIANYGVRIIPPVSMQDTYLSGNNRVSKLPTLEKDFHSSVLRVKGLMRHGVMMRGGRRMFRPRYAGAMLGQDEQYMMDDDPVYDPAGYRFDEGETDDSVGMSRADFFRGTATTAGRKIIPVMKGGRIRSAVERIGTKPIHPATGIPSRSMQAVVGSGGWLQRIRALLSMR